MVTLTFILTRLNLVVALLPLLTARRVVNLLRAIGLFLVRSERTVAHPPILILTVTSHCNYACVMCLKSSTAESRKGRLIDYHNPREMDFDRLAALLREHAPWLCMVRLHGGEPLHYGRIVPLIDLLNELRIPFNFVTNGSLLTQELADRLAGSSCFNIGVSLDAGTPETYAKVRRGGRLDLVLANLERLNQLKREQRALRPVLSASMCTFRFNIGEVRALLDLCRAHGIRSLSVVEGWNYDTPEIEPGDFAAANAELFRGELAAARRHARKLGIVFRERFPSLGADGETAAEPVLSLPKNCLNLYASVWLLPDFSAIGCSNAEVGFGNVAREGLDAVWNGDRGVYVEARRALREGDVPAACRSCIYTGSFFS